MTRLDFQDVRALPSVFRALEIAAAGGHNLLLVGAHTRELACRLPGILPPIGNAIRPYRAPHYTAQPIPLAQDVGLAYGGVLYLESAPEFRRAAMERVWGAGVLIVATMQPSTDAVERGYRERAASMLKGIDIVVHMGALNDPRLVNGEPTKVIQRRVVEAQRLLPRGGVVASTIAALAGRFTVTKEHEEEAQRFLYTGVES